MRLNPWRLRSPPEFKVKRCLCQVIKHHDPFQEDYVISHMFVYLYKFKQDYAEANGYIQRLSAGGHEKAQERISKFNK